VKQSLKLLSSIFKLVTARRIKGKIGKDVGQLRADELKSHNLSTIGIDCVALIYCRETSDRILCSLK